MTEKNTKQNKGRQSRARSSNTKNSSGRSNRSHSNSGRPGSDRKTKQRNFVVNDRTIAYDTLKQVIKNNAYSNIALNFAADNKVTNPGFVRELVYGVIKYRKRLDFYIDQLAEKGAASIDKDLLILLETGVYQILFMDSVPDHSAVDETVKIAKDRFRGKSGFINGVLRNFLRKRDELESPLDIKDPIKRISTAYSCDRTVAELLIKQYGRVTAEKIMEESMKTPPLFVHVNTLKTDKNSLAEELKDFITQCDDLGGLPVLELKGSGIVESDAFKEGRFFIQDLASVNAIEHFASAPGETVIDVCSAPGGKTMAIACRMNNEGRIYAFDLHENRLRPVVKTAKQLGIDIIETSQHDATEADPEYVGKADKVICDVPCSGLGVMRRKPEIRYKKVEDGWKRLIETQYRILSVSSEYVRPGGVLMYSTCTINKEENQEVTARFLEEHSDFSIIDSYQNLTGIPDEDNKKPEWLNRADGFYYCIMERKRSN